MFANATKFSRKSGVAEWRYLRFLFRFSRRQLRRHASYLLFQTGMQPFTEAKR
jgi:hypothetical protein